VCQALGRLGGETALDWLRKTVKMSDDKDVQAASILALANYADKSVIQMILGKEGLGASDRMTKLFSLIALGQLGAAFPPEDPTRQKVAAELKDKAEAVPTDKYCAMYGALGMAILGADSLNGFFHDNLTPENRTHFPEENHTAMAIAAGLLEARGSIEDLRSIVTGTDSPDYRGYAAFALGLIGDRKSADVIRGEMRGRQKAQFLRSCCWALGMIGDKTDTDLLISMLKLEGGENHPVRGAAAVAIGLIGDSAMVDPLVKIVNGDANPDNKAFAIAALGCLIDRSSAPRLPHLFANIHYRVELPEIRDVLTNL